MNMSYCRFRNTLEDLKDCYFNLGEVQELSFEEERAREKLIELCCTIAEERGYILDTEVI